MVLRKITVDNSVRYIPIIEKTKEKEIKTNTTKTGSHLRKQIKNISQNSEKFLENIPAQGFKCITK